jgi:chromosome segregation ATPase
MSALDGTDLLEEDFPAISHASPKRGRSTDREELDTQSVDLQKRVTDLSRELEVVERERVTVEESRRRFSNFETGRDEMLQELTRGLGLLEEAEHDARRNAEQMSKTIIDIRETLGKVEELEDIDTNRDDWKVQLTRNLTTLENARMEINSAKLKWPILTQMPEESETFENRSTSSGGAPQSFGQLCLMGLALTWPLVLLGLAVFVYVLLNQ